MKIITIFLLTSYIAFSQTREPEQAQINFFGTPTYLNDEIEYFKLNEFIFGWHWGAMLKIGKATHSNMNDMSTEWGYNHYKPSDYNDSVNLFLRASYQDFRKDSTFLRWEITTEKDIIIITPIYKHYNILYPLWTHCYYDSSIVFTKSMAYSAALDMLPGDSLTLNPLDNDSQNHVFGFKTKNPNCTNVFEGGIWRLKVVQSQVNPNTVILDKPFPNIFLTYNTKVTDPNLIDFNWSGRHYYLSINLRRTGLDTLQDNEPVLEIEVPYLLKVGDNNYTNGIITFDSIPSISSDDYYPLRNYQDTTINRGNIWRLTYAGGLGANKIIITRKMLPQSSVDNGDITISAFIDFSRTEFPENKLLRSSYSSSANDRIHELDIKVTYKGNCDVEINWLKFETPNTRWLTHGYRDSVIIFGIRRDVNRLTDSSYLSRGINLKRFTINVEPSPVNWASERYFSKLIGNLITGSHPSDLPLHYEYHINAPDRWLSFYAFKRTVSVPFCESNKLPDGSSFQRDGKTLQNLNLWQTLGIRQGYKYHPKPNPPNNGTINPFNSEYETFLRSGKSVAAMRDISFDEYSRKASDSANVRFVDSPCSIMSAFEWNMYVHYYDKLRGGFQFSEKPWYSQSFILGEWGLTNIYHPTDSTKDSQYVALNLHKRTVTTEEYRLMSWSALIQGAKGLFYDGDVDSKTSNMFSKLTIHEDFLSQYALSKSGLEYLELDELGGDYLGIGTDHLNLYNRIYNKDSVAKVMGTRTNRFYIGKKSTRIELRRLHEWVLNNEDFIMSQRLQAWFGSGYKMWGSRHPRWGGTDIMRRFINVDSVKTRKLYAVDSTGYSPSTGYEPNTDNFLDITLLADKTDTNMTNGFTIGVQNRRTDPLIYFTEDTLDKHILFLSTNELEKLCDNGGVNPMRPDGDSYPDTVWQAYYLKKFGNREITIPFNYKFSINPNDVAILRVTELRTENDSAGYWEWPWWRKERYDNYFTAVVKSNESISLKFLPGEGKMLKVEIVGAAPVIGELANSNQTKLIAYPVIQTGNRDFKGKDSAVNYHLVYHRKDPITQRYNVYYRRSLFPYTHDLASKAIQWGMEYPLTNTLVLINGVHKPNLGVDSLSLIIGSQCECKYPSLVARWDEVNNRANVYVLFSCTQFEQTDSPRVFIVEKVFDINSNPIPSPLIPIGYAYANGNDGTEIDRWGLSSINASLTGNFYAWNDTVRGITVGFKEPHDRGYLTNKLSMKFYSTGWKPGGPSLNTYSGIQIGDKHAAVAWHEEELSDQPISRIYYSMLGLDSNNNIYHYVPDRFSTQEPYFHDAFMLNGMAMLHPSDLFPIYKNPILYRTIEGQLDSNQNIVFFGIGDRVYWEGKRNILSSKRDIYLKMLDLGDSSNWNCLYPLRIFDINTNLGQPNLSQGSFFRGELFYPFNFSDSAIVVNFVSYFSYLSKPNYDSKIYQIDHDFWRIFQKNGLWPGLKPDTNFVNIEPMLTVLGNGIYPHLARLPVVNREEDWAINQRVFESADQIINTSYRFFLPKGFTEQKKIYPVLRIFDSESGAESQMSQFHIVDYSSSPLAKIPKIYSQILDEKGMKFLDTAITSWFRLSDFSQLSFFVSDYKNDMLDVVIERMSDGETFDLPIYNLRDKETTFNRVNLLNGGKEQYRIKYIRKNKNTWFMPEIMLSNEIDFVTLFDRTNDKELERSGAGDEQTIDLGLPENDLNILAFPNPSGDKVNVIVRYSSSVESKNHPIRLVVTNLLGQEIASYDWIVNKQLTIDFSDKLVGLYYINAVVQDGSAGSVVRKQIAIIR
jgi:hypothetical protein